MNYNLITTTYGKEQLNSAIKALGDCTDKNKINTIVEELIKKVTAADFASFWMYNSGDSSLYRQREDGTPKTVSMDLKKGLLYRCFAKQEIIVTNYLASEKEFVALVDNPDNIKIKSKIMIPLVDDGRFLGIATAYSSVSQAKKFDKYSLELFQAIIPFIINALYKIKEYSTNEKFDERSIESIEQLDEIQEQRENPQTSQEMMNYVANIVHDIRTPSNGLLGFLEILEEELEDERLKQYVSHAKESAGLISDLTTSILDGISSKRKMQTAKIERVSPFKLFGDIANMFSARMYQKQISYNIYIDPLLPKEIEMETLKLKRVIMNLIGNAYKFTQNGGTIEFSVRYKQKDKKIHLFVKDSGIGIAKEKQEKIFEAYEQADFNTHQQYGGTGLGLAISATYVESFGGKLSVDSEPDKGSVFYFDFPVSITDESLKFTPIDDTNIEVAIVMQQENNFVASHIARYLMKMGIHTIGAETSTKRVSSRATHIIAFEDSLSLELFEYVKTNKLKMLVVEENFLKLDRNNLDGAAFISQYEYFAQVLYTFVVEKDLPKVLIVDDDKISIDLIKHMLKDELCECDIAYDGKEGLEYLIDSVNSETPYSVIYSDTNMKTMSGSEMIQRYKEFVKDKTIPSQQWVSISGDINNNKFDKNYDVYIGKPFRKVDIVSAFQSTQEKEVKNAKTSS